ncbi:hypothetical protein [Paracoccus thiocyanatus]|nr:hypothetical protein [Paracoccus thiocyanatus]
MKRRDLMRLAPAALVATATPAVVAAGVEETPVMRLFRKWKAADAAFIAADEADADRLHDVRWNIETRLINTPSQNMKDVLIKLNAWTYFGDGDLEGKFNPHLEMFWAEAQALIGDAA